MRRFEVKRGMRVRVVKSVHTSYVGQEGEVTTYFRDKCTWYMEVRLDSGQIADFPLAELVAI